MLAQVGYWARLAEWLGRAAESSCNIENAEIEFLAAVLREELLGCSTEAMISVRGAATRQVHESTH
ncbi:hypothetical protein LIP_0473 [Limnochorda pilosa]|uniref:Uncharacterized protein n=1 Tax=Limnochorda pilosa TaxID=1555112 RepID=A0A0K2SGW2_LIMPI|nr:hypothetical protein LIP_0473 [Limnochorda pilosa]